MIERPTPRGYFVNKVNGNVAASVARWAATSDDVVPELMQASEVLASASERPGVDDRRVTPPEHQSSIGRGQPVPGLQGDAVLGGQLV
jgi:hypothetical protein